MIVDAHSKWPEVLEMPCTSAAKTITALRKLFASYGLPEQVVSDNGPQFTSEEFQSFMKNNGIKHIHCALYHPSSNGAIERFNLTFKQALKASAKDGRTLSHQLDIELDNDRLRSFRFHCVQVKLFGVTVVRGSR